VRKALAFAEEMADRDERMRKAIAEDFEANGAIYAALAKR
jgi:hypothetical protein